jgi:hypothetical protein
MKKNASIAFLLMATLCIGIFSFARLLKNNDNDYRESTLDARDELEKLYAAFGADKSTINITGTIDLYKGEREKTSPDESSPFCFWKSGKEFYNSFEGKIWMGNKDVFIELDTLYKTLMVTSPVEDNPSVSNGIVPLESWLSDSSFIKMKLTVSEGAGVRKMAILFDGHPEIESAEILYDFKNYKIKTVDMVWHNGMIDDEGLPASKIFTRISYQFGEFKDPGIGSLVKQLTGGNYNSPSPDTKYIDYELVTTGQ